MAEFEFTSEQIRMFAAGLYHVASVDGVDPRETNLIREFLADAGSDVSLEEITRTPFDAAAASQVLDSELLRHIFLKACVVLTQADGVLSPGEQGALSSIVAAFGMSPEAVSRLQQEAAGVSF
jgi:tellurite resistance protein